MAATLTDSGDLTYYSFDIDATKTEETADGNLLVYGRATDGSVDSDGQIVDPSWSMKALQEWLDTAGNVRVQHQAQRDPAGKGQSVHFTDDGHYVKSLIVEPVAKDLVRHKVLTAYSVGIARPVIEPDVTGKARGGIIKGGTLVELSLVDRPANKNCGIQLVKSADGGAAEWVGKVWGTDLLTKDITSTPLTATADPEDMPEYEDKPEPGTEPTMPSDTSQTGKAVKYKSVSLELPEDVSVAFSPADIAKLHTFAQELGAELAEFQKSADAEEHFLGKKHRKFSAGRRRQLAGRGHALPDGSYPIPDTDALRRAAILARSGHGNVAAARRLIARRAKELGVPNPLSEGDAVKKDDELTPDSAVKAATCDICKEPVVDGKCKCAGMKAEAEPDTEKGLARMDADDHDTDSDADEDDKGADKAAKPKKPKKGGKPFGGNQAPAFGSGKDDDDEGTDDSNKGAVPTAGVTGMTSKPVPAHREPDGLDVESMEHDAGMPTTPDSSVKSEEGAEEMLAALRLKSVGIAHQLGVIHDLTCPVFTPGDVAKAHPGATLSSIDVRYFADKAMDSAAGGSLEEAAKAASLWNHAQTLKSLTVDGWLELAAEAHKAFRDANPGPSSFPTPCQISPQKYNRGAITAGHAAYSPSSTEAAESGAHVPSGQLAATQFGRGFIQDGHAADSPANKGQGVPTKVDYVPTIRENQMQAMRAMHDHVAQTFPDVCSLGPEHVQSAASRPVPVPVGQGTPGTSAAHVGQVHKDAGQPDLGGVPEPDVEKAMKKLRRKMGKRVLAGRMTVDEARAKIGRAMAQKAGGQSMLGVTGANSGAGGGMMTTRSDAEPEVQKETEAPAPAAEKAAEPEIVKAADGGAVSPDLVKSVLAEALAPVLEKLAAQQKMLDAMADQPDPNVSAFRGVAQNPAKIASARPAGVQSVAEIAERTQAMMLRELEGQWRNSPDPAQREAAWRSIVKMRGITP